MKGCVPASSPSLKYRDTEERGRWNAGENVTGLFPHDVRFLGKHVDGAHWSSSMANRKLEQ